MGKIKNKSMQIKLVYASRVKTKFDDDIKRRWTRINADNLKIQRVYELLKV
jgi:hypothetical protein